MPAPDWTEVKSLLDAREGPCVSIYLPVHRKGRDTEQDPLRFRNLLEQASGELQERGERSVTAAELLQPGRALFGERPFWSRQQDGLAVFLAPGYSRIMSLPFDVPELVVTGSRFHLRPLVLGLRPDKDFYTLALSRAGVRLLRGGRFDLTQVPLSDVPEDIDVVFNIIERERQLQSHTGGRRATHGEAVFHGHGDAHDEDDERVREYFRAVDRGVMHVLHNSDAPLVLAGVEYLLPLFRDATSYAYVLEETATGSTDAIDDEQLHRRSWAIVEPLLNAELEAERERYDERAARGLASHDVDEVIAAARQGRVDTVFLSADEVLWGRYDEDSGETYGHEQREPGDEDLLDRAMLETMLTGGKVYPLEGEGMPEGSGVAAIFRY